MFLQEMTAKRGIEANINEISNALLEVGLSDHYLSRNLYEGFSGGEKKRLEFAQALLFKPQILILDELDSGLDIEGVRLLTGKTRELAGSGVGVLYISHNIAALRLLRPNRVVVMMNGGVVAERARPQEAKEWFDKITNNIKNSLEECCKEVEFSYYYIMDINDLKEAFSREASAR